MSVSIDCCTLRLKIRRGDSFKLSFVALKDDEIVDLTGYEISAWSSTPGGRCLGEVSVVDRADQDGAFDLICVNTYEWVTDLIEVIVRFVSPGGEIDSTESIKIAVVNGDCVL